MDVSKVPINEVGAADNEAVSLSVIKIKPRTRRIQVAPKVRQWKSKFVSCSSHLQYYKGASKSTTLSDQDFIGSIPCHAIFVFLDTILLGVLQVEHQNKKESPLDTHPVHMQTFLMAICIYSALLGIKIHTHTCGDYKGKILCSALFLSGALSSASLLSILLQRQLLWVVLFIWGSIALILARHFFKSLVCQVIQMVAKLTWDDVRNCKVFAAVVSIFHNKDSANGSNNTVDI